MNKFKINYIIDFFVFISFFVVALTGLIIFLFLPSGIRQGRLQEFIGIAKEIWNLVHIWFGILMTFLVTVHFILHWDWIVCMTKTIFGNELNKENDNLK
jgi:hypothetical protein